jgi:hypothetical protein
MSAVIAPLSVGWQLAIGLGAALFLLAAIEGAHLLIFPRRALRRLAVQYPARAVQSEPVPEAVQPLPQPAPKPLPVSSGAPRRWQRPERARPKSLRMRRPQG